MGRKFGGCRTRNSCHTRVDYPKCRVRLSQSLLSSRLLVALYARARRMAPPISGGPPTAPRRGFSATIPQSLCLFPTDRVFLLPREPKECRRASDADQHGECPSIPCLTLFTQRQAWPWYPPILGFIIDHHHQAPRHLSLWHASPTTTPTSCRHITSQRQKFRQLLLLRSAHPASPEVNAHLPHSKHPSP